MIVIVMINHNHLEYSIFTCFTKLKKSNLMHYYLLFIQPSPFFILVQNFFL